jgi:hypothetical protein
MFRLVPILLAGIVSVTFSADSAAQAYGQSPFDQEFLRVFAEEPEEITPQLTFKLLNEIELPGPLPGGGPTLVDDRVAIPVAGFQALTDWAQNSRPEFSPPLAAEPDSTEPIWVEGPEGRRRYRTLPEGRLVAEKRCRRCDRGWRKLWKLRLPGSTLAPPLVTADRIYVGAMDNRIYCLKRRNGHRLWTADAESRLGRRLVFLTVDPPEEPEESEESDEAEEIEGLATAGPEANDLLELVLAVPDDRAEIQAWSAKTGKKIASFRLAKDEGKLIGVPLAIENSKIVVARQWYASSQASLMVLQMSAPKKASPKEARTDADEDQLAAQEDSPSGS